MKTSINDAMVNNTSITTRKNIYLISSILILFLSFIIDEHIFVPRMQSSKYAGINIKLCNSIPLTATKIPFEPPNVFTNAPDCVAKYKSLSN